MPSGGLLGTDGRTYNASESEVRHAKIQRASTRSSIKTALHVDPSSSSSVSSSGKCDKAATSVDRVPQRTSVVAVASNWPSSNSATVDRDAAREEAPSALSNTKSRTRIAKVYRASSSVSTSRREATSAQVVRRPRLDGRLGEPDRVVVLGAGRRSSC
jgi:hypothetical protein